MKLNIFNKTLNALVLMFVSVLAFAQEARPGRLLDPSDVNDTAIRPSGPEHEPTGTVPGHGAPIDDYQFLLIGVAVLLIAYFIYKRRQALQA